MSKRGSFRTSLFTFSTWWLIAWLIAVAIGAGRGHFTSESQAQSALQTQGFTDYKLTDTAFVFVSLRGCGGDAARYDYTATNPIGKRVQVSVCVGWPFKGATVRSGD